MRLIGIILATLLPLLGGFLGLKRKKRIQSQKLNK